MMAMSTPASVPIMRCTAACVCRLVVLLELLIIVIVIRIHCDFTKGKVKVRIKPSSNARHNLKVLMRLKRGWLGRASEGAFIFGVRAVDAVTSLSCVSSYFIALARDFL